MGIIYLTTSVQCFFWIICSIHGGSPSSSCKIILREGVRSYLNPREFEFSCNLPCSIEKQQQLAYLEVLALLEADINVCSVRVYTELLARTPDCK